MNTANTDEAKKKKKWIGITIFIVVTTILYPFFYEISPIISHHRTDFDIGYLMNDIFFSIFLFGISATIAHRLFRMWVLSFVGLVLGILFTWVLWR